MKEYFGKNAEKFGQTKGKQYLLAPAIKRALPRLQKGKLLDVGCGNGDLYPIAKSHGYAYYGLDISPDMINRVKQNFPNGYYRLLPATNFAKKYTEKFDVVVVSMLFLSFKTRTDITRVLSECRRVLTKDGIVIIGIPHPAFDHYMQTGLFGRTDTKTKFQGYFNSGAKFITTQQIGENIFHFTDHHWTLNDYMQCINKAGLSITSIDECPPDPTMHGDRAFVKERKRIPTYLLITCK